MATNVTIDMALYADGPLIDASNPRFGDASALAFGPGSGYGGVYNQPTGKKLSVGASSGMNITIDPGTAIIPSAAGVTDGAYRATNTQTRTLTCTAADITNPRIDLVVIGVTDLGNASSTTYISIQTGTPAPSPSPPATPSNALALGQILVGANVASINAGNITDLRVFTCAPGGILPVAAVSSAPQGTEGLYGHDSANHRLFHVGSAGATQAKTLPWSPQVATSTADSASTGVQRTLCSVTVTVDGSTDLEIQVTWPPNQASGSSGGYQAWVQVLLDTTLLFSVFDDNRADDTTLRGGGGLTYHTCPALGNTPAAGTHTVTLAWAPLHNAGDSVHMACTAQQPAQLYVRAVPL